MLVGCCATRAQMRHAATVVFLLDFDVGKNVYRVHPINIQSVADPRKKTDVILVQKVLTNTSHVTSCIVMLKDVNTFRCCRKGRRIGSIMLSLYFTAFKVPCTILSTNSSKAKTIIPPAPKRSDSYTHWFVKGPLCLRFTR